MITTGRAGRYASRGAMAVLALALAAALTCPTPSPAQSPVGGGSQLRVAAEISSTPGPMAISTMPAIPGFPVTLDGVTELTDDLGKAHFTAADTGKPWNDRITFNDAVIPLGGREVRVRANRLSTSGAELVIRLDIDYHVQFRFSTVDGSPIDASSIKAVTLKSTYGEILEMAAGDRPWLHGTRVARITDVFQEKTVAWSVQRVEYAGSNVVNASQQTFIPAQQEDVDVRLLFFGLELHLRDALFGFSHDGAVDLVYPDGRSQTLDVGKDGQLSLPALPRGAYTLVTHGSGPDMSRPLTISRDQQIDVPFYSWLDILAVLGSILGLAVGLVAWGARRRRHSPAVPLRESSRPVATIPRRHGAHATRRTPSRLHGIRAAMRRSSVHPRHRSEEASLDPAVVTPGGPG